MNIVNIYTSGAFLSPAKVIADDSGKWDWRWVVTDFQGNSLRDGEDYNPPESADTLLELLRNNKQKIKSEDSRDIRMKRLEVALKLACERIADSDQTYSEAKSANDWFAYYLHKSKPK